jgi:hypothetical protein
MKRIFRDGIKGLQKRSNRTLAGMEKEPPIILCTGNSHQLMLFHANYNQKVHLSKFWEKQEYNSCQLVFLT